MSASYSWGLRYASHLTFRPGNQPLFIQSVGSLDPRAHVKFAAELGFCGVLDAFARSRPEPELHVMEKALADYAMEGGAVLYVPVERVSQPLLGEAGASARAAVLGHIRTACAIARRIRSRTVAVVAAVDSARSFTSQRHAFKENLRAAAEVAEQQDITLAVETMRSVPNMLLRNIDEQIDLIEDVGHPSVRMLFDTHHVASFDGVDRVLERFCEVYKLIGNIQLANYPVKFEPGAGEIEFVPLLAEVMRRQFPHLVELEHVWSESGKAGEISGIARFAAIDAAAQRLANDTMQQ